MQNTPNSNRVNIVIVGAVNSGKSSLLNSIVEQNIAIVSSEEGTTTDSVKKAMELIPFGPVLFIDTAGFNDNSKLGNLRIEKTINEIKKSDFAIYVIDGNNFIESEYQENISILKKYSLPYLIVVNKEELLSEEKKNEIKSKINNCLFISTKNRDSILNFKKSLIEKLNILEEEPSLLKGIVEYGDKIVLVVPIDSEAPKGRLILPQVQILRDALDNGIKSIVCRDTELEEVLKEEKNIKLVITDSQAFKNVDKIVDNRYPLTSFSILFARQKGEISKLIEGIEVIKTLKENSNVLIAETCTHNTSHEDIGRVKIPTLLQKKLNKKINFTFSAGKDFPEDLSKYDLVIHCGGCMITRKNMENRIKFCNEKNLKVTNYGLVLAYLTGILEKAIEPLK
ncbi:[FeFe] hydrogenase H-cluster maturation GTPase HydF [Fusobacterium perfoetens]|uniref:[FeFe] hydrogenase H-cluster maturation GTPase HydF n=1 Tax=Fusobacterium perfoetens TaxID=852 RepID=UPI000486A931|nr:[FeFe] hydrogenase H-cluster maturation GTPase HydF [Fusobacterium perfoetens]